MEADSPAERRSVRLTLRRARMLNALGLACRLTGRYGEAGGHYDAAIAALEALPRPLDGAPDGEAETLCQLHTNAAQLCRTQAVADAAGFLRHMRASAPEGVPFMAAKRAALAALSDAELLRRYQVGALDEGALRRERTRENVALAASTGYTAPNPRAWVLRPCAGCAAAEAEPGQFKRCGPCGVAVYCTKACQTAHWKGHKADCRAAQAAKARGGGADAGDA